MALTREEIYGKIRTILVGALGIEEEEVTPAARLTEDLGAESIDFLDIAFQTERTFGVRIEPEEMLMGALLSEPYVTEGKITDLGMAELRRRLPQANFDGLERSRDVADIRSVFTVETLVSFVVTKLADRAALGECLA